MKLLYGMGFFFLVYLAITPGSAKAGYVHNYLLPNWNYNWQCNSNTASYLNASNNTCLSWRGYWTAERWRCNDIYAWSWRCGY